MPIPVNFCYPASNAMTDTHLSDKAFAALDLPESCWPVVREAGFDRCHPHSAAAAAGRIARFAAGRRRGWPGADHGIRAWAGCLVPAERCQPLGEWGAAV